MVCSSWQAINLQGGRKSYVPNFNVSDVSRGFCWWSFWIHHQEFQVPKMEVLNHIRLFWGWVFPYRGRIHTAYIGDLFVSLSSLVFQIPFEDRCLNPQTPPEVRPLGAPFTPPQKVFGGFWKTRVKNSLYNSIWLKQKHQEKICWKKLWSV